MSETKNHNAQTVLKCIYFTAVIDGVFCLVCDIQTREAVGRHVCVDWDNRYL